MMKRNSHIAIHNFLLTIKYIALYGTAFTLLYACANTRDDSNLTLADIDIPRSLEKTTQNKPSVLDKRKSQEDIRQAYRTYVENSPSHDNSRQKALTRLAQLELELSNDLLENSPLDENNEESDSAQNINQSLQRTIILLETTLEDYPKAKNNDTVLYQLAQAYDGAHRYQDSLNSLKILSKEYRQSIHYPEAQFRLAEAAFARGNYLEAEDAYSEVILTPGSEKFYEKSIFKRGWTRYKQQLYAEALDDYIDAIDYHQFEEYINLSDAEKTQFNEYFRALGLAFSQQDDNQLVSRFFKKQKNFKYLFEAYSAISDVFVKQERFFDATQIMLEYRMNYPTQEQTALAQLKVISIWQQGGFKNKLRTAIENGFQHYHPSSNFWNDKTKQGLFTQTQKKLRQHTVEMSSYYHEYFIKNRKKEDLSKAKLWYERYLESYPNHANQDNIYSLYAELLINANEKELALKYYNLSAYDGKLILDKEAAYSSIVLSQELLSSERDNTDNVLTDLLNQHLEHAQLFVELYPQDPRSIPLITATSEKAFQAKRYAKAIEISHATPNNTPNNLTFSINNIKARAYLELQQYVDAESVFMTMLNSGQTKKRTVRSVESSLALAIYRQAERAQKNAEFDLALSHFIRIKKVTPNADLAATGLYDAIAMTVKNKSWNQAITLIEEFKHRYPKHRYLADVTKKLSAAYLHIDQKDKAAKQFEQIAKLESNLDLKKAALWKAAELYDSKKDIDNAIRAYRDYAHKYKMPYSTNIEAMYKLTDLYKLKKQWQKRHFWQLKIKDAAQKTTKNGTTERTIFIASTTILDLARSKQKEFSQQKLVEPIARNLKLKKASMQEAIALHGLASSYGIQEITTESTHSIGLIYQLFSQALLTSERPKQLNSDELTQYDILLEDQAFPFEEKAIEFYETNMSRTRKGTYDRHIELSLLQLKELFPVRYQRKGKASIHAN